MSKGKKYKSIFFTTSWVLTTVTLLFTQNYYLKNGKHIDGVIYSVLSSDNFARSISTNADTKYSMENIVKIISSVLSSVVVDENSAMCNLVPWDSLSHMNIMLAIKEETGVNLSAKDIAMATSVKNIFELVNLRQSENKK